MGNHTVRSILLPCFPHDPLQLLFPYLRQTAVKLDATVQAAPEAAGIPVRCRRPIQIPYPVNLSAGFIEGVAEYISCRCKTKHRQGLVITMIDDPAPHPRTRRCGRRFPHGFCRCLRRHQRWQSAYRHDRSQTVEQYPREGGCPSESGPIARATRAVSLPD